MECHHLGTWEEQPHLPAPAPSPPPHHCLKNYPLTGEETRVSKNERRERVVTKQAGEAYPTPEAEQKVTGVCGGIASLGEREQRGEIATTHISLGVSATFSLQLSPSEMPRAEVLYFQNGRRNVHAASKNATPPPHCPSREERAVAV